MKKKIFITSALLLSLFAIMFIGTYSSAQACTVTIATCPPVGSGLHINVVDVADPTWYVDLVTDANGEVSYDFSSRGCDRTYEATPTQVSCVNVCTVQFVPSNGAIVYLKYGCKPCPCTSLSPELGLSFSYENGLPDKYQLYQNYPNPFNPTTTINFGLPKASFVTLKVYDILGNEVLSVVNEFKQAGSYSATVDASALASGIYFYKINAGEFSDVKKLMLLK